MTMYSTSTRVLLSAAALVLMLGGCNKGASPGAEGTSGASDTAGSTGAGTGMAPPAGGAAGTGGTAGSGTSK